MSAHLKRLKQAFCAKTQKGTKQGICIAILTHHWDVQVHFGALLAKLRADRDLRGSELDLRVGVSRSTTSRYEQQQRFAGNLNKLHLLLLGMSEVRPFTGEEAAELRQALGNDAARVLRGVHLSAPLATPEASDAATAHDLLDELLGRSNPMVICEVLSGMLAMSDRPSTNAARSAVRGIRGALRTEHIRTDPETGEQTLVRIYTPTEPPGSGKAGGGPQTGTNGPD